MMSRARNYLAWQGRVVLPHVGTRVLEIGCGIGNFTEMLLDREAVIAVDSEPDLIDHLKGRYQGRQNLTALVHSAADGFGGLEGHRADSCVCVNVLEHIQDDRAALRGMAAAIRPGGAIVLIVPAFAALQGPIDCNLGHYRRYSRSSLAALAADCGLRVRTLHYMNLPGLLAWWLNARVLRRTSQSPVQIRVFDRFVVPAASFAEQFVSPPFGQSLFCVLVQ